MTLELFELDETTQAVTCLTLARILENSIVKNPQLKKMQEHIKNNPGLSKIIPARLDNTRLDEKTLDDTRRDSLETCQTPYARSTSLHENNVDQDIETIFTAWQIVMNHPKSKLDDKRRRVVKSALKSWSVEDLIKAVKGCAATPYNMGQK